MPRSIIPVEAARGRLAVARSPDVPLAERLVAFDVLLAFRAALAPELADELRAAEAELAAALERDGPQLAEGTVYHSEAGTIRRSFPMC